MDETWRQAALDTYRVLDTPAEVGFDNITQLAAELFGTPVALVSLLDRDRQWFKSRVGLDATQTPRNVAFCQHAIGGTDVFLVPDATRDARFASNPLVVGAPGIRFYAGAPLITPDGFPLGTLCIIDYEPRSDFDVWKQRMLMRLASMVVDELELRREIIRRRDAEAELREQGRLLSLAEEVGGFGHWYLDPETGAMHLSDEGCRIHGHQPSAITPALQRGIAAYHPDDRSRVSAVIGESVGRRERFSFEARIVQPDGEVRNVVVTGAPDPDGARAGVLGVVRDITERRRADAELAKSQRLFQTLARLSPAGIFHTDADGRCLYVNDAWSRFAGMSAEEAMGDGWSNAIHPDDRAAVYRRWTAAAAAGSNFTAEYRFLRQDGTQTWLAGYAAPERDGDGRICGYVGVVVDITERKQAEAELERQAADMCALAERLDAAREEADGHRAVAERATQAKSDFLAAMSHEIRTPMNGVIGMTELLFDTPLSAEQRQFASTIRNSANALLTIINDILDFSKMEAGKLTIESAPFDPFDLVKSVIELLAPQAMEKGVKIGFFIAPSLRRNLIGDADRIRQILINLVGNAVKFTQHGAVTVDVSEWNADAPAVGVRIDVVDTGIGIPQSALSELFTRFQQVDDTISRRFGGTGLGLAICRQLVELMGGRIGVESVMGEGSRFRVDLPLGRGGGGDDRWERSERLAGKRALAVDDLPPDTSPEPVAADEPGKRSGRILLAEDTRTNQPLTATLLRRAGYTVALAGGGSEAVSALASASFDLVLVDIQMPGMDGYETALAIRSLDGPASCLPIIALTADVMPNIREKCLSAGMNDLVRKPPRCDELLAAADRWLAPSGFTDRGAEIMRGGASRSTGRCGPA